LAPGAWVGYDAPPQIQDIASLQTPGRSPLFSLTALLLAFALLGQAGCGWPRVHKVIVQQGNVISQEMIDQLKPGMTRTQVAFIMGEPVVRNTFNNNRWDYVYTIVNPGYYSLSQKMSLYFENDSLRYFTGDYAPTSGHPVEQSSDQDETPI
jgi:outer membrane protein assembly factor BamE